MAVKLPGETTFTLVDAKASTKVRVIKRRIAAELDARSLHVKLFLGGIKLQNNCLFPFASCLQLGIPVICTSRNAPRPERDMKASGKQQRVYYHVCGLFSEAVVLVPV